MKVLSNSMPRAMVLAPGKERSLFARHLWIFSGAVKKIHPDIQNGECCDVLSASGEFLARAFLNRSSSIVGRIISFEQIDAEEAIKRHLLNAISYRKQIFPEFGKGMCRLVNAEADMLSGLIIDLYGDTAVLQISALGIERHKQIIVETLRSALQIQWIIEKSTSPSRKIEGLTSEVQTLFGTEKPKIIVEEDGLKFAISVQEGQKTGFFIDQRETREIVRRIATKRRVLNCFSYSGAFSITALAGGALSCCSIDCSAQALQLVEENLRLNGFDADGRHSSLCADVFEWLENNPLDFDVVILDPPAFAKRRQDVDRAIKGYREINRRAMEKMPSGSFLLTCSCSYHVEPTAFMAMLKQASLQTGRRVRLVSQHRHAWDHPMNLCHPETDYLKSALLYID